MRRWAIIAASLWLAGANCQPLATGVANAEAFRFRWLRLTPDANGLYTFQLMRNNCNTFHLSAIDLAGALNTKQFTIPVNGAPQTFPFSFEALGACSPDNETVFETDQLEVTTTDPNGVTQVTRPKDDVGATLADAKFNSVGRLDVKIYGGRLFANSPSNAKTTGSYTVSAAEVPSSQVGASAGALYTAANQNPAYQVVTVDQILSGPERLTGSFSFLAKSDTSSTELLIVWDGEMVLRTDL
ncbi:MAG TPA: hypothetical protein VMR50_07855 [Myxococcota bacterium]|nr:hypothetical protein [Myxococcota bacterium]